MNKHIYSSLHRPLVDPIQNQIDSLVDLQHHIVDCMSEAQKSLHVIYNRLDYVEDSLGLYKSKAPQENPKLTLIKNPKSMKGETYERI